MQKKKKIVHCFFHFAVGTPSRVCPLGDDGCISRGIGCSFIHRAGWFAENGHVGYDHKGQDPHQHEGHGDGDDGAYHGVVALVGAKQPAQATSDPVGRPAYIYHRGRDYSLLHGVQVTPHRPLALLTLDRQREDAWAGFGRAVGGRVLQQQLALAALEADGQSPLHVRGQFADDVLVVAQAGQVLAVGELGHLTANGAGQALELQGGHVDTSQALQAEGVSARQQLGGLEDVIIRAEADGALGVLQIVFRGLHLLPVALPVSPVSSPGLLTPPPLPPLLMVPVSLTPSSSIHPLRVGAPRPPHFCRKSRGFLPRVLLTATLAGFGFDIGRLSGSVALAPFRPVSLPLLAHVGRMMSERERRQESDSQCPNWSWGKLNLGLSLLAPQTIIAVS